MTTTDKGHPALTVEEIIADLSSKIRMLTYKLETAEGQRDRAIKGQKRLNEEIKHIYNRLEESHLAATQAVDILKAFEYDKAHDDG